MIIKLYLIFLCPIWSYYHRIFHKRHVCAPENRDYIHESYLKLRGYKHEICERNEGPYLPPSFQSGPQFSLDLIFTGLDRLALGQSENKVKEWHTSYCEDCLSEENFSADSPDVSTRGDAWENFCINEVHHWTAHKESIGREP